MRVLKWGINKEGEKFETQCHCCGCKFEYTQADVLFDEAYYSHALHIEHLAFVPCPSCTAREYEVFSGEPDKRHVPEKE